MTWAGFTSILVVDERGNTMFDQLTIDELKSLMATLITRDSADRPRFSSNRMARMLARGLDTMMFCAYQDLSNEIAEVYTEAGKRLCSLYDAGAAA